MPQNHSQLSSQRREVSSQKYNDIDERHLILKGQSFSLRIPDPNAVLHLDYLANADTRPSVDIITHSGVFSQLPSEPTDVTTGRTFHSDFASDRG